MIKFIEQVYAEPTIEYAKNKGHVNEINAGFFPYFDFFLHSFRLIYIRSLK